MRWPWVLPLLVGSAVGSNLAVADMAPVPDREVAPPTFWVEAIEPHSVAVTRLLALARESLDRPGDASSDDTLFAVDERQHYFVDAYHLAAYAHRLSPTNADAIAVLGIAADELGKIGEARSLLELHVKLVGLEKADFDALVHLGAIHLRLGALDEAIAVLRYTQGTPARGDREHTQTTATLDLAQALLARGDVTGAIDVYLAATPTGSQYLYGSNRAAVVLLGLAVLYDRLELRGAAFDQLSSLRAMLTQGGSGMFARYLCDELNRVEFVPAEDLEYFRALAYEAMGKYVEARAEWLTYAAVPHAAWRSRALDHVALLDARARAVDEPPPVAPVSSAPAQPAGVP